MIQSALQGMIINSLLQTRLLKNPEDVPAWVCPNCGRRYFDADVLEAMEARMKTMPADARPIRAWAVSLAR